MKKPSITYLIWNTNNNGGNKIVFEHVNRLLEKHYDIKIVTVFGEQPSWFKLNIKIQKIVSLIKSPALDILVATFWPTAYIAFLLPASQKFYFIQAWEENFYRNNLLKLLVRFTLKLIYKKITISKYLEKNILNYTKNKCLLFRLPGCAVDSSIFRPNKKNNKNKKEINILSVLSWYKHYKGPDLLAKAVSELKKRNRQFNFILVSCEEKPYSNVFDKFISNPDTNYLARIYQNADILLMTSRCEGFLLPGLEAMACGCLVVTTDCGGIKEYAIHKKNAVILENIDQLWKRDEINNLIHNKRLINKLITNGYKTVRMYHWDKILLDLESIYSKRIIQ